MAKQGGLKLSESTVEHKYEYKDFVFKGGDDSKKKAWDTIIWHIGTTEHTNLDWQIEHT